MATYGLTYPDDMLASVQVLNHPDNATANSLNGLDDQQNVSSDPKNQSSICKITPETFSKFHLDHILSHPPDNVLFPFLHGLEGENEAQNSFFITQGHSLTEYRTDTDAAPNSPPRKNTIPVPKYRGLMWVVCEDDLDHPSQLGPLVKSPNGVYCPPPTSYSSSSSYSQDDSDFELDDDLDDIDDEEDDSSASSFVEGPFCTSENQMDMDVEVNIVDNDTDTTTAPTMDSNVVEIVGIGTDNKHMHPVNHRIHPPVRPIQTSNLNHAVPPNTPESIPSHSTLSSSLSTSNGQYDYFDNGNTSAVPSPPTTTPGASQPSSPKTKSSKSKTSNSRSLRRQRSLKPPERLPLLTCTFRAKDLIRQVRDGDDSDWEFIPMRVPDGISLRNFGIQVPILCTLSDIVVYSPTVSGGGNSPNALALAHRFQIALERKRRERCERLGLSLDTEEILRYNVFVLDANAGQIEKDLRHLMLRVCEDGEVPGSLGPVRNKVPLPPTLPFGGTPISSRFASKNTPSGVPMTENFEMDLDKDGDVQMSESVPDGEASDDASPPYFPIHAARGNTVDFAQRERDEMRDLTKATEIISIFPPLGGSPPPTASSAPQLHPSDYSTTASHFDPLVGQVFLGNSNDVPFPPPGEEEPYIPADDVYGMDIVEPPSILSSSPSSAESSTSGHYHYVNIRDSSKPRSQSHGSEEVLPPLPSSHPLNHNPTNLPECALGYDICIECHDLAPVPNQNVLKATEDKITKMEELWQKRWHQMRALERRTSRQQGEHDVVDEDEAVPPRPPPHANSIIHLPFPSSPARTPTTMNALINMLKFLEKCIHPPQAPPTPVSAPPEPQHPPSSTSSRRWSLVPSFPPFSNQGGSVPPSTSAPTNQSLSSSYRSRSYTSPASSQRDLNGDAQNRPRWSRPLKILLYSSDGYTESSVPALSLLMLVKGLTLPEAYLELQVAKRRSFFVYQTDLDILRRIECRIIDERKEREQVKEHEMQREREKKSVISNGARRGVDFTTNINPYTAWANGHPPPSAPSHSSSTTLPAPRPRPAAKSVSFAQSPFTPASSENTVTAEPSEMPSILVHEPSADATHPPGRSLHHSATMPPLSASVPSLGITNTRGRRPRASTSPSLPSLFGGDHQAWFNDPRFDGSFPSRVLPFLYLGNLAHASNAYMLHALGITHVVSVGECALIPPPNMHHYTQNGCGDGTPISAPASHWVPGRGSSHQGSLWIEERAGRIKVMDIQGVCDDGIDTLEPQLEPICDWIDKARKEGGQVLVHCRVGVSRSATVTIAYVMKHLGLPLVDAYLIVRSRRLSVLIQPNMRLLYNLCGWEIKLAKERAGNDEKRLRQELTTALSWPYLANEVHKLNEKYLH